MCYCDIFQYKTEETGEDKLPAKVPQVRGMAENKSSSLLDPQALMGLMAEDKSLGKGDLRISR